MLLAMVVRANLRPNTPAPRMKSSMFRINTAVARSAPKAWPNTKLIPVEPPMIMLLGTINPATPRAMLRFPARMPAHSCK